MLNSENYDIVKLHKIMQILSNENSAPDLTSHLEIWARNKKHIYELFGNELKVKQEVQSCISNDAVEKTISQFLDSIRHNLELSLVYSFLKNKLSNGSYEEIIQNYLKESEIYFGMKFSAGMKISRILPKLTTKKWSEWVQIEYSKIVQSFFIKGTAVLSIDPVDYITMSENQSGWRSCHSLDGEYRTGTLSYMMDSCSVVAYVTNKDISYDWRGIEKVVFSDKMWRQMVLINIDGDQSYAIQSRQYPNSSINNSITISNILINLLKEHTSIDFHMTKESVDTIAKLVEDNDGEYLWYNDIRRGSFQKGRAVIPVAFPSLADFIDNEDRHILSVWVGVNKLYCACGCGERLEDAEYLYYESKYEDECDDEEDYE